MKHLELVVEKRSELGRGSVKKIREAGKIPAVIYGHSGVMALTVNEKDLKLCLKEKGNTAALVDIHIAGDVKLADIADIQKDPLSDKVIHIDFHELSRTEKMTTIVPLEFIGESTGVKNNGGILDIARHEITVKCLPADLPSCIQVDVSALDLNDIIHLGKLELPNGVEAVGDKEMPIVSCKAPEEDETAEEVTSETEGQAAAATDTEKASA